MNWAMGRFLGAALAVCLGLSAVPAAAQAVGYAMEIPAPVNEPFYMMPPTLGDPITRVWFDNAMEWFSEQATALKPPAINYYNKVMGTKLGMKTKEKTAKLARAVSGYMSYMNMDAISGGLSGVSGELSTLDKLLSLGCNPIEMWTELFDDHIRPHLHVSAENALQYEQAIHLFKLGRELYRMVNSWDGSLLTLDLLKFIPSYDLVSISDGEGGTDLGITVGLRYKDGADAKSLLERAGLEDPFVGEWGKPVFRYRGPKGHHWWNQLELQVKATPYSGAIDTGKGALQASEAGLELMDRVFFEGVMGRYAADHGVAYRSKTDTHRPSPKLLQRELEFIRDERLKQIDRSIDLDIALRGAKSIDETRAIEEGYEDEKEYIRNATKAIADGQIARWDRIRSVVQPVQEETVKLESQQRQEQKADDNNTGFFDSVFHTIEDLKDIYAELRETYSGGTETTGPEHVFKARVAYAMATHSAYEEGKAIREALYAKLVAMSQNNTAKAMVGMAKELERRKKEVGKLDMAIERLRKSSADMEAITDKISESATDPRWLFPKVHSKMDALREQLE